MFLCTGLKAIDWQRVSAAAVIDGARVTVPIAVGANDDVYVIMPLAFHTRCPQLPESPTNRGGQVQGSVSYEVDLGDGRPVSWVATADMLSAPTSAPGEVSADVAERFAAAYRSIGDESAMRVADALDLVARAVRRSTTSAVPVASIGISGCVAAYNCDCGDWTIDVAALRVADRYLENVATSLPGDPSTLRPKRFDSATCHESAGSMAYCSAVLFAVAVVGEQHKVSGTTRAEAAIGSVAALASAFFMAVDDARARAAATATAIKPWVLHPIDSSINAIATAAANYFWEKVESANDPEFAGLLRGIAAHTPPEAIPCECVAKPPDLDCPSDYSPGRDYVNCPGADDYRCCSANAVGTTYCFGECGSGSCVVSDSSFGGECPDRCGGC